MCVRTYVCSFEHMTTNYFSTRNLTDDIVRLFVFLVWINSNIDTISHAHEILYSLDYQNVVYFAMETKSTLCDVFFPETVTYRRNTWSQRYFLSLLNNRIRPADNFTFLRWRNGNHVNMIICAHGKVHVPVRWNVFFFCRFCLHWYKSAFQLYVHHILT